MSQTRPILTAIEAHLKAQCQDWAIELMPNNPREYYLTHPNGAVLIGFQGSTFESPRPTSAIIQRRELRVTLTIMSRDLHNDFGAIALLDKLRVALVGFTPPNCSPVFLQDEAYTGTDETGIWVYELTLATTTQQVQR